MTSIKDRVLQIAEHKSIKKIIFFKELGLSYANFKGIQKKSALNSDAIDKILSKYTDIRYEWLISGKEPMLKQEKPSYPSHLVGKPDSREEIEAKEIFDKFRKSKESPNTIKASEAFIASLEDHIVTLKKNNQYFIDRITYLENQLTIHNYTNTPEKLLQAAEPEEKYSLKNRK